MTLIYVDQRVTYIWNYFKRFAVNKLFIVAFLLIVHH